MKNPIASVIAVLVCLMAPFGVRAQTVTATVPVGPLPIAVAVNPVTNQIYVANAGSNNVTVIDGSVNTTTSVAAGTSPNAVAVNPVANRIYAANNTSNNVTVVDGATNTTTTVTVGSLPTAVAVNPVSNRVYVANNGSTNVTVLTPEQVQTIPLTTTIAPILGGLTTSPPPAFTFSAASTFTPQAPAVENVYFQFDSWQGPWIAATASGANFTGSPASPLSLGTHIVYAFATDGQDANSTGVAQELIGNIAGEVFTVTPSPTLNFTIAAAPNGSTSATVKAGQTANYALQLSLTGGVPVDQLSVTITCTGAPSQAVCTGPAAAVTVTQTMPGAVAISVTTVANGLVPPLPHPYPRSPRLWLPTLWALALLGLAFCLLARKRAQSRGQRKAWAVGCLAFAAPVLLLLLTIASISGCGGGGAGNAPPPSPPGGTPVGMYTLTVTATSGTLVQRQNLSFTVQ